MRVLVAGQADFWPDDNASSLSSAGVRHLGLDASDGIEVADPALRARTRLAVYTSGDIRGEIVVGQVQRIQCGFDPINPVPGTISANITAIALDNAFSDGAWAIGFIRAGNGITGAITAAGDPVRATPAPAFVAGIRTILVGPSTDPVPLGIRGDILAKYGAIGSILTTGPIGSAGQPVQIIAGDGVFAVRARTNSSSELAAVDFHVNLRANDLFLDPTTLLPAPTHAFSRAEYDGVLTLLETAGGLFGSVRAANLGCGFDAVSTLPKPSPATARPRDPMPAASRASTCGASSAQPSRSTTTSGSRTLWVEHS
ncbi:MAG: hypothetical protein ACK4WH_02020 [Phycisphaerales bacterium]